MRHDLVTENDPPRGISVSSLAREYPRGSQVPAHSHGSDQIVYASCGVMEVASGHNLLGNSRTAGSASRVSGPLADRNADPCSLWMIPPHFGLWIPARTSHQIRMPEAVSMRTLYLRPGLAAMGTSCVVFHVTPFLRELIFEIVRTGRLRLRNGIECAMRDLLVAQLARTSPVPVGIALPRDPRALRIAQAVMENPSARLSLASMCESAGVSVRTLERIFRSDVGVDFESWRRQVRLMRAIELLVKGSSVKEVAFSIGYSDPSAFVALFRAAFATTPKAWVSSLEYGRT